MTTHYILHPPDLTQTRIVTPAGNAWHAAVKDISWKETIDVLHAKLGRGGGVVKSCVTLRPSYPQISIHNCVQAVEENLEVILKP